MRPEPKKRIDTNAASQPRRGMSAAFAGLDLPNLPAGSELTPAPTPTEPLWKPGRVVLRKEKAHRGGKTVIVVHDFATHLPQSYLEQLAKKLRQACGTGGTVSERTIEIQGDQAGKLRAALEAEGFQVAGIR